VVNIVYTNIFGSRVWAGCRGDKSECVVFTRLNVRYEKVTNQFM